MHPRNHAAVTANSDGNEPKTCQPTALIAEDSRGLRALVTCQLCALGYNVLSADGHDAQEIIRKVNGRKIDLLITDRNMPRVSGDELVRWFRQEKADARIIVMSTCGDALPDHDAFLQKPFTLISLHRKVRETLNRKVSPERHFPHERTRTPTMDRASQPLTDLPRLPDCAKAIPFMSAVNG